jgi:hypothetical protein
MADDLEFRKVAPVVPALDLHPAIDRERRMSSR